jgi:hypothetical protein
LHTQEKKLVAGGVKTLLQPIKDTSATPGGSYKGGDLE